MLAEIVSRGQNVFLEQANLLKKLSFPRLCLPVTVVATASLNFAIGLGMVLGVLNVFFRDVGQLFGVVLQFWFWLTPIVYPVTIVGPPSGERL